METYFEKENLNPNPVTEFLQWQKKMMSVAPDIADHMILATLGKNKRPSARTVLLKGIDNKGLRFFTNYNSRKSQEIKKNLFGAVVFDWHHINLQIRSEGKIKRLTRKDSEAYFRTRPRLSQIGAWASPQGEVIPSRQFLLDRVAFFENKFENSDVPCPPNWGGFILQPEYFEFMFSRQNRLHDRFCYKKSGSRWKTERLGP